MKKKKVDMFFINGETITVRNLEKEDLTEVCRMEAETFSMPWSREAFAEMVHREDSLYLVAEKEHTLIGCCGVTNICGDGDINNVVVKDGFRKNQVGTVLLNTLLERGKELGINNYTLEVRVSNIAAIKLYQNCGFVSEGVRPNFYEKPVEDANIMWIRKCNKG